MEAYEGFAQVYDLFMDNIDYDGWCAQLTGKLAASGITDGLVCELGCGTGEMTERLAAAGYDMIGIDRVPEMLQIAGEKRAASGADILYLCQDMRAFELYGTVRAFVSVCNSLNYLLEASELLSLFRLVHNYLDPGGLFLFDLNTPAHYRAIGEDVIAESRDEAAFIWENHYEEATKRNHYRLNLFVREDGEKAAADGARFLHYEELHVQRAWEIGEITALLDKAGLSDIRISAAYRDVPATEETARVLVCARRD